MSDTALTAFLGSCLDLLQTSLEVNAVYSSHVVEHAYNPRLRSWDRMPEGQPELCSETIGTHAHRTLPHTLSQSERLFRY